ncbi:MAG TPA: recombinase family protein [Humibacter sp.]|nr:recombinase family protein [Humibacter sp.]
MPNPQVRAAIYARQSLDVSEGIERQIARCRKLIADREWSGSGEYIDNDVSASKARGAGTDWARLLRDAESRLVTHVVAVDLDRLIRSTRELLTLIDLGLSVVTVDGEIDLSTADGEFRATLLASLARFEVRRKSERQERANAHRVATGRPVTGRRPFGFESDRLTPREPEAEWVRWAVQAILDGSTLYAVRKRWNDEGVTTATGRAWLTTTVRQVLMRPSNAGLLQHRGQVVGEGGTPLVPLEQWEAMRAILEHPDRTPKRGPKVAHVASGVVVCSVCGSAMRFHTPGKDRAPRYTCTREKLAVRDNLQHPTILRDDLERLLAEAVFMALTQAKEVDSTEDDAAPLRVERAELARRRKVQQDLAELPGADLEATAKRLRDLGQQIEGLDGRIAESVAADSRASLMATAREALDPREGFEAVHGAAAFPAWLPKWDGMPIEKRHAIIRDLFGPIVLGFKDLYLTKTDQRITREKWTPETWNLEQTRSF